CDTLLLCFLRVERFWRDRSLLFVGELLQSFCFLLFEQFERRLRVLMLLANAWQPPPIAFVFRVEFVAVGAESNEPFHDALFAEHVAAFHHLRRREDACQRVVIGGWDRIKLVVVAPRTAERL